MKSKVFAERFNRELDAWGLPTDLVEKTIAVSKVFGVSRHLANSLISGLVPSENAQLGRIAEILGVCPNWLIGTSDKKKAD